MFIMFILSVIPFSAVLELRIHGCNNALNEGNTKGRINLVIRVLSR